MSTQLNGNLALGLLLILLDLLIIGVVKGNENACCNGNELCFTQPAQPLKVFAGADVYDGPLRNSVTATVQVCSKESGQSVYFKAVDIDDPSTDVAPVDPNGSQGDDNLGSPKNGELAGEDKDGITKVETDENGVAQIQFKTSIAPGDNYKVYASIGSPDFAANNGSVESPEITVWRELHIEIDRMKPAESIEYQAVMTRAKYRSGSGQSEVFLHKLLNDTSVLPGRFENGQLVTDKSTFKVLQSSNNKLYIEGEIANKPARISLADDDKPLIFALDNLAESTKDVFSKAFIAPVINKNNPNSEAEFSLNSLYTNQIDQIKSTKDYPLSNERYWAVTIHQGFQMSISSDNDPDSEKTRRARAWPCVQGVFIASEEIRDWITEDNKTDNNVEIEVEQATCPGCKYTWIQDIINHEIGHLFGLEHGHGAAEIMAGVDGENKTKSGLMVPSPSRKESYFTAKSLHEMRKVERLPIHTCP